MKTAILTLIVSGLLIAAGGPVPRKAAEIPIHTPTGGMIPFSKYPGKTILLAFVLTDCPDCQMLTKALNAIQKDYEKRGLQVIESALDGVAPLLLPDFQRTFQTVFPVGFSTTDEAAKFLQYAPGAQLPMPIVVIVDRNGTIRSQWDGKDSVMKEMNKNIRAKIDQVLAGGSANSKESGTP